MDDSHVILYPRMSNSSISEKKYVEIGDGQPGTFDESVLLAASANGNPSGTVTRSQLIV